MLQPNPNFVPLLGCYDLTRTGTLPASDGCPNSTSGLYNYYGHANIRELALFVQDTITKGPWRSTSGFAAMYYDGIVIGQPGRTAARRRLQHQADQHRAARFLCPHPGNAVQREPGAVQHGMQRSGDQRHHGDQHSRA